MSELFISGRTCYQLDEFTAELRGLLNRHCVDGYTATPDFLLARYLVDVVEALRVVRVDTALWENRPLAGPGAAPTGKAP